MKDLHALWCQYTSALLGKRTTQDEYAWNNSVCAKMIKADLCGAKLKVIKSKNRSLEGVSGIVSKETQRSFVIVTKSSGTKIILKKDSVFRVGLPSQGKAVDLWGDMLLHKGSERTKVKFKERGSLDLY